jgi:enoyl-CoA hydratase/3-hydroxyacyl-CoA dehydrogenase
VDLDIKENIATITINRPEAMNALNETVFDQLESHFNRAESVPDVKAIVFQGAGKAFVAGADIRYFLKNIHNDRIGDTVAFTRDGHKLLLRIENSPKLTVALLDGLSLGGGSELALACQAVIATPAGSMGFPETGIGIYPGFGGMLRLARHVGPELAKYFVFTGTPLSAKDAETLGIVNRLVKPLEIDIAIKDLINKPKPDKYRDREIPESFEPLKRLFSAANIPGLISGRPPEDVPPETASKILKIMGYKAPLALKLSNEIIDRQMGLSIEDAVEIELSHLEEVFRTADALEGLSSLGGKRPVFKGK